MADSPQSLIEQLYFGRDAAEVDKGAAGLLRAGFVETAAYRLALTGRKNLLIGRRGAGKSAICVMLALDPRRMTAVVTPDEVSADEIRQFELRGITLQMAKQLIWRYVLCVQIARLVVAHARSEHERAGSADALRKFLLANGELTDDFRWHERFWRSIQRLKSSLSLEAFGIKASVDLEKPEGIRVSDQLRILEERLDEALRALDCPATHGPFLIMVDKLEEVWSNDTNSDDMIVGLLAAVAHVSALPSVRCIACLRSDIYDVLRDREKFHGDEMRIAWSRDSLRAMLVARAQASLDQTVSAESLFGEYFAPEIGGQATADYLIERTLMRPRDLIQFANLCRDTAEQNGHSSVHETDVLEAERQYSFWKLQDLTEEYRYNYPFLADLYVVFQNSGYVITRSALARRIAASARTLGRRYRKYTDVFTEQGVVAVLYRIGFLGVRRNSRFEYTYDSTVPLDGTEQELCVHPCFRQAMGTLTATGSPGYQPPTDVTPAGLVRFAEPGYRGDRAQELFAAINVAGYRVLRIIDEVPTPYELRAELTEAVTAMIADTSRRAETGGLESAMSHAYRTAAFLHATAEGLNTISADNDPIDRIASRIRGIADGLRVDAEGDPRPSEISG